MIKVSIVTVAYNSEKYIADCIRSVLFQTYSNIEYIVIDGSSNDNTLKIVNDLNKNGNIKIVSEPDNGIYDAMNKGIKLSTGDIVGIINSDDFFCHNGIIERIVNEFIDNDIDAVYGDVQFVNPSNINKTVRYYSSKRFNPNKFKFGFMPAHPSFYINREFFEKYGYYKTDYKIAADFELLLRFILKNKIKCSYIGMPFVTMRTGGVSNVSLRSNFILNKEIIKACKENSVKTNIFKVYSKYFIKIFEFIEINN